MDKIIKEKEENSQLAVVPLDTVPIASLLQTSVSTTTTIVGTSLSIVLPTLVVGDSMKIAQSMENLTI